MKDSMPTSAVPADSPGDLPSLLVVDDDLALCRTLKRVMTNRGFATTVAHSVEQAIWFAEEHPPEYAIIDLNMPGGSGLQLVRKLKELDGQTAVVVLTGYASIATAIEAIKLGATHYLAKPATASEILAAFKRETGSAQMPIDADPLSVQRIEWEHIQKILLENNGNITATARKLKMHRRTLQRKLAKRPGRE